MSNLFFGEDVLFDSHCHLNDASFETDRDGVVNSSIKSGVTKIIDIAIDVECSHKAVSLAHKYAGQVYACVGIDPDAVIPTSPLYAGDGLDEAYWEGQMSQIRQLALQHPDLVVAIGETGIDNYWLQRKDRGEKVADVDAKSVAARQESLFRMHLSLAAELDLPLSVHSRAAEQECADIIRQFPATRGVFHSFTGSFEVAKQVLDAGWGLGVNGIITFANAHELRETYRQILGKVSADWSPQDFYSRGVYFETDAPYLAPAGHRGERNEPKYISQIFQEMLKL